MLALAGREAGREAGRGSELRVATSGGGDDGGDADDVGGGGSSRVEGAAGVEDCRRWTGGDGREAVGVTRLAYVVN